MLVRNMPRNTGNTYTHTYTAVMFLLAWRYWIYKFLCSVRYIQRSRHQSTPVNMSTINLYRLSCAMWNATCQEFLQLKGHKAQRSRGQPVTFRLFLPFGLTKVVKCSNFVYSFPWHENSQSNIHIKFKTRAKTVKVNSKNHSRLWYVQGCIK